MTTVFLAVIVALMTAMIFSMYRVFRGPTIFDRLTGLGLIGSKSIILLLLLGGLSNRLELFIDIALSYGMISFIGALALAKYFESGKTQP